LSSARPANKSSRKSRRPTRAGRGGSEPRSRLSAADRALLGQLLARHADAENVDLVEDLIVTAVRLLEDGAERLDVKVMTAALKELRYAAKVFAPYRGRRKVTVFGSARTRPDAAEYQQAAAFAKALVARRFMVITGGGEGIMGAAQRGAGREHSFGLNIRLPFEQAPNVEIVGDLKLINFKYFFTRKLCFIKESDAIALFPGGFGTHDEGFEALTLMQTGKSQIKPLVFVDAPRGSYWKTWWRFVEDQLLDQDLISREDFAMFKVTDDLEEASEEITRFYSNYHSSRYYQDRLLIRVQHPVSDRLLRVLNERFADLCAQGATIRVPTSLPAEDDDPELQGLHRLEVPFNRSSYGRLRMLIDVLNQH